MGSNHPRRIFNDRSKMHPEFFLQDFEFSAYIPLVAFSPRLKHLYLQDFQNSGDPTSTKQIQVFLLSKEWASIFHPLILEDSKHLPNHPTIHLAGFSLTTLIAAIRFAFHIE